MLNSVAKYLWGSAEPDLDLAPSDAGDQLRVKVTGEVQGQLAEMESTPVPARADDGDWVIVGLGDKGVAATTAAWCSETQARVTMATAQPSTTVRVTPSRPATTQPMSSVISPRELSRVERSAQKLSQSVNGRVNSSRSLRRHTQAAQVQSLPRVPTLARRNKRLNASGAKSSRCQQRM